VTGNMEFCLLGPLAVRRRGTEVPVPPGKQRALLAALLLRAGHLVRIDELTEVLWGQEPPPSSRATLQNYVKRLRRTLGPGAAIRTEPGGYCLDLAGGDLDVTRFEAALAAGRSASARQSWDAAAEAFGAGLALWRGTALAGVPSEVLAAREVPRLAELRCQALEGRVEADLALGRHGEVVAELRRLVAGEPLRERLHGLLMAALAADGQQAAALAAYQDARALLVAELGAEPGADLQRLQARVLTGDLGPGIPDPAALAAREAAAAALGLRYSLPVDTAAFTGRSMELDRITAAVAGQAGSGGVVAIRAIDGMPGVGKTALAVHAAHLLRDRFPDRQLFIDLHGHTPGQDPVGAGDALAGLLAATGVDPRYLPAEPDSRAAMWRDKMAGQRVLLVLDNAASSAQVAPLLPGGDQCLVLVTSRRHLADLPGAVVPVLLEALPPAQARDMFIHLAPRAVDGAFGAVTEVVRLAGFLPLAISLLARVYNRHPSWTLADLAAETRASLLTMAAEHDSVAAAFAVSYQHLPAAQQALFRLLGVHPGTDFDAYAAAALAGTPPAATGQALDALHREGLLTETGYRRYRMHDLLRRYAADRAASDPPAARQAVTRLLDYYQHTAAQADARLARHARPDLFPAPPPAAEPDLPDVAAALAWDRTERASLLAGLDHAVTVGDDARIIGLTAATAEFLRHDGPRAEAAARQQAAVAAARRLGHRRAEAAALTGLSSLLQLTGDYSAAAAAARAALGISVDLGDRLGQANARYELGEMGRMNSDYDASAAALEAALADYRQVGDQAGQATALNKLGVVWHAVGDYPAAIARLEEALAICRARGSYLARADVVFHLGQVRRMTGDYREAGVLLAEALTRYRDLGSRLGQGNCLCAIAMVEVFTGTGPGTIGLAEQALDIFRDVGSLPGEAVTLVLLGEVLRRAADYPAAARALARALDANQRLGSRLGRANALSTLGAVYRCAGDYPAATAALTEAVALYRELGDRGGEAEAQNEVGAVAMARGDTAAAIAAHRTALDLAQAIASARDQAMALAGLARCARAAGDPRAAADGLRQARDILDRIGAAEAAAIGAELAAAGQAQPGARVAAS
jgi:DNA-binding SARP family transcriptional activator/tetratricopeptide (TPR) repeat protein